jgi:TonB family protein
MKRRLRPRIRLLLLMAIVVALFFKTSPSFAKESTPQEQWDQIAFEHPMPRVTPATWKIMWPVLKDSWSPAEAKLLITVEKGTIKSVAIKQSTGFKAADDDIADWIRTKWHFRPGITRTIGQSIYISAPMAYLPGGRTLTRPLTLTKRDLGKDVTISTERLLIRTDIDQGRITKISVLKSTGDRELDAAAVRWVKENWALSSKSGVFETPVIFSRKE